MAFWCDDRLVRSPTRSDRDGTPAMTRADASVCGAATELVITTALT